MLRSGVGRNDFMDIIAHCALWSVVEFSQASDGGVCEWL